MKILGIDIGTYSIKAVELDVNFGKVELYNYVIEPVEHAQAENQLVAIKAVVGKLRGKTHDRVIVNLPKAWATTRLLQFPTKDRRTIQNSLQFELDDDIPFDLEDIIYDFVILDSTANSSTVFSALTLKKEVLSLVSQLQMLGIDPDAISIESWALGSLLRRSLDKELQGHPVCVANIGHLETTIQIFVKESPILTLTCQTGGADITRAIASRYNISFDEAEKIKIDSSFVITDTHRANRSEAITEDQEDFSRTITKALSPIVRDIKQAMISFKSKYRTSPRAILITGGTSLISNLHLYLEEKLQVRVYPLNYMSNVVGQTLQLAETTEAQIAIASGLGLSIIKFDRNTLINLRQGELAKRSGFSALTLKEYAKPLRYVAASLAFIYINLIIQGVILSQRSTQQQERLEKSVKSVLGTVTPSVMSTYLRSPSVMKAAVNKEVAKFKPVNVAPPKPQVSALDILNKVSAAIPRDITLDMQLFEIKDGSLQLKGLVDQALDPDRIARTLQETKLFIDVKKGAVSEVPLKKKHEFEISAKLAEVTGK